MGLKDDIQTAVDDAFQTSLGDLVENVTYQNAGVPTYDPATGTTNRAEASFTVLGVFVEFQTKDIDGEVVKPKDKQFLFAAKPVSFVPTVNDRIVQADGTSWEVFMLKDDPAGAHYNCFVRGT